MFVVLDYELQISLSEALCRLTPRKQRPLKANSWFFNDDISRAFCDIRDRDFEVVSDGPLSLNPGQKPRLSCSLTNRTADAF